MSAQLRTLIKDSLKEADSAHDWEHITRVVKTSTLLATQVGIDVKLTELVALLHEIGDPKLPPTPSVREILSLCGYPEEIIGSVERIVPQISFSSSLSGFSYKLSPEEQLICDCVSDADKLDAVGAIGIARTLAYTGAVKRPIYKLDDPPRLHYTPEEYKASGGSTTGINHFFEKLFRLESHMKTEAGKAEAKKRSEFMRQYLDMLAEETGLTYPAEAYQEIRLIIYIDITDVSVKVRVNDFILRDNAKDIVNQHFFSSNVTTIGNDFIYLWLGNNGEKPSREMVEQVIKEIAVPKRKQHYV